MRHRPGWHGADLLRLPLPLRLDSGRPGQASQALQHLHPEPGQLITLWLVAARLSMMTPPLLSLSKHLVKVEGDAAE